MRAMSAADRPRDRLDDAQLGLAVEENLYDLFRAVATLPGGELVEGTACSVHHAFPTNPMFKGIWGFGAESTGTEAMLREALDWQRRRDAPFVFAWASSTSAPPDLDAAVAALGFEPWEQNAPCQVAELASLDWGALDRVPDGFTIERVADDAALEAFGRTFGEALGVPAWAGQAWVDATRAMGIGRTPWVPYVGWLDGAPVATNMLFCGAGVASVFGVGTIERARGRGIGAAITLAGLGEGLENGYRYGVLFATDLGAPVYRRIGFRDVGIGISRWLWRAS
jgi:hypothetical protein